MIFLLAGLLAIPKELYEAAAIDGAGPWQRFRWVTLPDWPHGPIRLTEAQAVVFKALWSFKGEPRTAEQIMRRAGLDSDKPIDVFKGKKYAEPLRAYQALVTTQQRAGLYSMPCAAAASPVPA